MVNSFWAIHNPIFFTRDGGFYDAKWTDTRAESRLTGNSAVKVGRFGDSDDLSSARVAPVPVRVRAKIFGSFSQIL